MSQGPLCPDEYLPALLFSPNWAWSLGKSWAGNSARISGELSWNSGASDNGTLCLFWCAGGEVAVKQVLRVWGTLGCKVWEGPGWGQRCRETFSFGEVPSGRPPLSVPLKIKVIISPLQPYVDTCSWSFPHWEEGLASHSLLDRVAWEKFGAIMIVRISFPGDLSLWAWRLLGVWTIKALGFEGDSTEFCFKN